MLGSSLSAAMSNTVIATILADEFRVIADRLETFKYIQDTREEALKICGEIIRDHGRILFSGDGYSDAWVAEATMRGLPNIHSFVESIDSMVAPKAVQLFARNKIFTESELHARAEILHEQYVNTINAEAKTLIEMVDRIVLPEALAAVSDLQPVLAKSALASRKESELCAKIDAADALTSTLKSTLVSVNALPSANESGLALLKEVTPLMANVRQVVDALEASLPTKYYPLPDYCSMLFQLD